MALFTGLMKTNKSFLSHLKRYFSVDAKAIWVLISHIFKNATHLIGLYL